MPQVSLAKAGTRYECVTNALSGMAEEIEKGIADRQKILIKPNMVHTDNQDCATNVEALRAVIEFVQRYDPQEVLVGEGSSVLGGVSDSFVGFQYYGYLELMKAFPKLAFYNFNQDEENYEIVSLITGNREEIEAKISKKSVEERYRISLTKPKTHQLAILSLSMKNMMGCIVGPDKIKMHGYLSMESSRENIKESREVIHQNIPRLVKTVPPSLSVIDGFEAMGGKGPLFGEMVNLGVTAVSNDYVAADAVMSEVVGFDPIEIGYIYYADKAGLGCGDLSKIEITGTKIEDVKIQLAPPPDYNNLVKWKLSEWYP